MDRLNILQQIWQNPAKISIRGSIILLSLSFLLTFSCSKNSDTQINPNVKYCGRLDWSSTLDESGYFTGTLLNSRFNLVAEEHNDGYHADSVHLQYDSNNHIINNDPNYSITYNQDKVEKLVYADDTSTITVNFDNLEQLSTISSTSNNGNSETNFSYNYTYDQNGDPTKIIIHGTSTDNDGTEVIDFNITGSYLTDHINFLPDYPELTPFSAYFAFTAYLSKHLIDKWQIQGTIKAQDGTVLAQINFTQQYTYTYNSDGEAATMVHTGNPNNIYSFTYSQCP